MNMRTDWDEGLWGSGKGYRTLEKRWEEGELGREGRHRGRNLRKQPNTNHPHPKMDSHIPTHTYR